MFSSTCIFFLLLRCKINENDCHELVDGKTNIPYMKFSLNWLTSWKWPESTPPGGSELSYRESLMTQIEIVLVVSWKLCVPQRRFCNPSIFYHPLLRIWAEYWGHWYTEGGSELDYFTFNNAKLVKMFSILAFNQAWQLFTRTIKQAWQLFTPSIKQAWQLFTPTIKHRQNKADYWSSG